MTRWQRLCTIAVRISVAVGIVFGFLPRNWIELLLGIYPDGGSGLVELLLVSIPVAIAVGIAILVYRPNRSVTLDEDADPGIAPALVRERQREGKTPRRIVRCPEHECWISDAESRARFGIRNARCSLHRV